MHSIPASNPAEERQVNAKRRNYTSKHLINHLFFTQITTHTKKNLICEECLDYKSTHQKCFLNHLLARTCNAIVEHTHLKLQGKSQKISEWLDTKENIKHTQTHVYVKYKGVWYKMFFCFLLNNMSFAYVQTDYVTVSGVRQVNFAGQQLKQSALHSMWQEGTPLHAVNINCTRGTV